LILVAFVVLAVSVISRDPWIAAMQAWDTHCCSSGSTCTRDNAYFWQCRPASNGGGNNGGSTGGNTGGNNQGGNNNQPGSGPSSYKPQPPVPAKMIGGTLQHCKGKAC